MTSRNLARHRSAQAGRIFVGAALFVGIFSVGTARAVCPSAPRAGCRVGRVGMLHVSDRFDDRFDRVSFDLRYADQTEFAEFGDPVGSDDYELCIYGNGTLAGELSVPFGRGWSSETASYAYRSRDNADGVAAAGLRAGNSERSRVWLRGAGPDLPEIALPIAEPVVAQLQNADNGLCFDSSFAGPEQVLVNSGSRRVFRGMNVRDPLPPATPSVPGTPMPTATPTKVPQVYDIEDLHDAEPETYIPTVDQVSVLEFTVGADHGGPLHIGHPIEMHAQLDVLAEPFEAMVWFGLQDEDGDYCVIDHISLEHLSAMYGAAERANIAVAEHNDRIVTPSLSDCSSGQTCPAGEECAIFEERAPIVDSATLPDTDISHTVPQVPEDGPAPDTVEYQTVRTYMCTTQAYAAARVSQAKSAPKVLTPADLAGSVQQRHIIGSTDELPESCANLIGASEVTGWLSFDPEFETNFTGRPAYDPNDPLSGEAVLDEEHEQLNQEIRAYRQKLPEIVPVEDVLPDPGLDVDFRHLRVGSSVVLVDQEDHPSGDLHVDADYSLDGEPSPEQAAALPTAQVNFSFTMRPVGEPRAGCVPPNPLPSLDPVALQIVHENGNDTRSDVDEEPAHNLSLGAPLDQSFPLYLPPDVRDRVYGEWSCWEQFDIDGCISTDLTQDGEIGTSDDCAFTSVIIARNTPPENAEIVDPPAPLLHARVPRIGSAGCSDSLFKDYAENMKKHYELQNSVHIDDFYSYDYLTWVWGSLNYPGYGNGFYEITNAARQQGYYNHIKSYLTECEALGGQRCWTTWAYNNSPWNINKTAYQNGLIPYFWNQWNSGLGSYANFKANAQGFTRSGFNFECEGIYTGKVCSFIGYDLTKVPALATMIRTSLYNRYTSGDLPATISPHGAGRCPTRAFPALRRIAVDDRGKVTEIPEDGAFFTQYLAKACEKGKYKAEADRIWQQIASSCTYVAKPFADSGAGIYAGRFVPELYKTYDTGFKAGLKGVVEGGIVNDYIVATALKQFKLIFGAQGRVYLESDPNNDIVGGINVRDIFKTWMLGNFYNDVLSSSVEAGFHVMTHDIWKISFKLPTGEFELPEPPELSKEVEKCKYLWKFPMPFRIELCGSVGGKLGLEVSAKVLKTGIEGVDPNKSDWPGISGTITPGVAVFNKGRAGVDVLIASAGLVLTIDPTIGVYIPVEVGAKWNLAMPTFRQLDFNLSPYVKTTLELKALGGQLSGYTRWKIGSTSEEEYPIPGAKWDPLTLGDWELVKHSWEVKGSKTF